MSKAFLSHSSKDKSLVEKIAIQLGSKNCHYDKLTFEAGAKTLDEIFKGLEDTDVFVLFISEPALESEWVKNEIINAKSLLSSQIIERIFPIIIDKSIEYSDARIPIWIRKPYNIKSFSNEVIILKKIKQILREVNYKQFSHIRELEELFVGRNDIMQKFEQEIINIDNIKPTFIIASSFFDGIGRRTFLKNGLIKTRIISKLYEPIYISINSKESIEDFLYKLNFIQPTPEIFKKDLAEENMDSKINLARKYVYDFVNNKELVFIIDEGSIVLPNNTIVDWFEKIITDERLKNQLSICLISKFKPYIPKLRKLGNVLFFQINELSKEDTQTLFIQYLNIKGVKISPDDTRFFLSYLKGIPSQIIYTGNLISSMTITEAKHYVKEIEEFDELRALSILQFLEDDELSKQMLIALSKFEIISYDLVYKIFGENEEVFKSIQKLFDLTLFYPISSTHEYLKLNSSVADYINRSKLKLKEKYTHRIKEITNDFLAKPLELNEYSDYSEFLFTLQKMIENNITIPKKYLIPSFLLKSIVREYNSKKYRTVINLARKLLDNESKFDYQIIRETRFWLCLAYCRRKDEEFFNVIKFFNNRDDESMIDYHFLFGFYYRNIDDTLKAEEHFLEVLKINPNHSRTKRELVNIYLRNAEYSKALELAADNYYRFKTNIYHIQAFYTCLIKKKKKEEKDYHLISNLLEAASKSMDNKASDILREMKAEYSFYVENDSSKAVRELEEILHINKNNYYAYRALVEIFRKKYMYDEIEDLKRKHPNIKYKRT